MRLKQAKIMEHSIIEDMNEEELNAWIRAGCEITGTKFADAKLRFKFHRGLAASIHIMLMTEHIRLSFAEARQHRRAGKLSTVVSRLSSSIEKHKAHCTEGSECFMDCVLDAVIFASVCKPHEIAMYTEQDDEDFHVIRDELLRWRNWRAVMAPTDKDALH